MELDSGSSSSCCDLALLYFDLGDDAKAIEADCAGLRSVGPMTLRIQRLAALV